MIDQKSLANVLGSGEPKGSVLWVAFVPNKDGKGEVLKDWGQWITTFCECFTEAFGGATAMPEASGFWKHSQSGDVIREKTVLIHSYAAADRASDPALWERISSIIHRFGSETGQDAVGLLVDGWFHSISDYRQAA